MIGGLVLLPLVYIYITRTYIYAMIIVNHVLYKIHLENRINWMRNMFKWNNRVMNHDS